MAWVRLEDTFCEHPKIEPLDDGPFRLHVRAICYANRNLTDGFVPAVAARAMGGARHKSATKALVDAGLWELARGGYRIHDFLEFQPAREAVLKRRERDRFRKDSTRNPSAPYPSRTQGSKEPGTTKDGDVDVTALLARTHLGRLA